MLDDVMNSDEALDSHCCVAGVLETVHESVDGGRGGGARAVAEGEKGGEVALVGRRRRVMGGGTEEGKAKGQGLGVGKQSSLALRSLVFELAEKIPEISGSSHLRRRVSAAAERWDYADWWV